MYQAIVNENVTKGTTYTFNGTVIDQEYIDNNFDGDTFKADTKHTLNFFYMERGGSLSYCQLKFNLPNTVMNHYGFALGSDRGNPNIKYAAAAYLVLNNPNVMPTDAQIASIQDNIKNKAQEIVDGSLSGYPQKGTNSKIDVKLNDEVIGKISVVVYEVSESKLLTNKNRLNFMAGYKSPTGDEVKTVLAFTSLYYNDGKAASSDNGWYVSYNFVTNVLTSKIGM